MHLIISTQLFGQICQHQFHREIQKLVQKHICQGFPNVEKSLNQALPCVKADIQNVLNTAAIRDVACKGDCTAVKKCKNDQHSFSAIHLFPGNTDIQIPLIVGLRIYHHEEKSTECWEERLI